MYMWVPFWFERVCDVMYSNVFFTNEIIAGEYSFIFCFGLHNLFTLVINYNHAYNTAGLEVS